jgi:sulfur carrier protein
MVTPNHRQLYTQALLPCHVLLSNGRHSQYIAVDEQVIALSVNGDPRQFEASASVADLIRDLGLEGKRVAVERNGEIVPRSSFTAVELADGDSFEIVVAVGGG